MVSRRRRQRHKKQSGGGWGFDGSTFASAGGAPLDVRSITNDCQVPVRVAPAQLGGSCTLPQRGGGCGVPLQTGGGCGCNKQTGGSCGVPLQTGVPQQGGCNSCAPMQFGGSRRRRRQKQRGGGGGTGGYSVDVANNDLGKVATYIPGTCSQKGGEYPLIPTHTASYSLTDPVLLDSGARYMEVQAGQKAGSRRRRRNARKQNKTRRH